ncbi:MAG: cbb3-type cytochrome c oxidase subunit I [Acidimicrobiales bacterium]|nr:cbb3-type cytochrome c oxidase subunit I [Acidimicrobiales bacterium]
MAVIDTAPETAATHAATAVARIEPTGFAALLGTGDHKVIGRLYIATSLLLGAVVMLLGLLFSIEAVDTGSLSIFTKDTVFQFWTLLRVGGVFLLAFPLVIGVAMVVVPLQVGAKAIAFPRAAAASYWAFLLGAGLFLASYAINGGPGGGSNTGVNLWIASLGLIVVAILLAAVCLATTVFALRQTGLTMNRIPLYAWSVAVAAVMWLLTLPVLVGVLVLMYVDHRHGGSTFGDNASLFNHLDWVLRNPQVYVVAVPVLGFAADVLATTAKARIAPRFAAQGAIGAFGIFGFGAFLAGADAHDHKAWVVIALGVAALLPVLAILGLAGDLFRRGSFAFNPAVGYAVAGLLILLLTVAAGALGSFPGLETYGTIFDVGVSTGALLATLIASLGAITWWATKIGRQPVAKGPAAVAPVALLLGSAAIILPDLIAGLIGDGPPSTELSPSWVGGIEGVNVVAVVGVLLLLLGVVASLAAFVPIIRTPDQPAEADPWEGQSLEWLAPSPPPLDNFDIELPVVVSAEPLVDLREEK